jgi:hypothetical protein
MSAARSDRAMSAVEQLLQEFIREFRASGDADPLPYLRQLQAEDRSELAALIDGFLASSPPPPYDPDAFAAFRTSPHNAEVVERILAPDETLVELRKRAGLHKADMGRLLAERFGFAGRSASAKACYHEIETGQVPPARVREDVWRALSDLLGETRERIQHAAELALQTDVSSATAFTRPAGGLRTDDLQRAPGRVSREESDPVRRAFFVDAD